MIYSIVAILFTVIVCLIIIGHIKEAWYDMTHMDEYRERVAYNRELRQAKKEAIAEYNKKRNKLNAQGLTYRSVFYNHPKY